MTDSDVPSPELADLARAHGVAVDYWDWHGRHVTVGAATIVSVLAALGIDAATPEAASRELAETADQTWRRTLPPTTVVRQGVGSWVPVHVPHGEPVTVRVDLEAGGRVDVSQVDRWVDPRSVDDALIGEATFAVPGDLPLGWHRLVAMLPSGEVEAALVVTPNRLDLPAAFADGGRCWGLMTQLYQVRSARSWGVGDLGDLAEIATWGGNLGADFVLINPVHSAEPSGHLEPSPYLPTTRRFANPIYLAVADLPGYAALSASARASVEALAAASAPLNLHDHIDRDTTWLRKREALELIHAAGLSAADAQAYAAYRLEQGEALDDFATWCALADAYGPNWRTWPQELQHPRSATVTAYRHEHEQEVDFHAWLQFEVARQRAGAQGAALAAGMRLGVVNDLAVGVHPEGADAWGLADVLAQGVTVGAPPDQFNQLGQNWHQPPWHPGRLAEVEYAPFRAMVRAALVDSGGLRIDHIMGLFRLWWVPRGETAEAGTYVRYDHEALVGILALEAYRAGAIVVGEDLGVVEPMVRDYLLERGLLGTSILWFEWGADGEPLPSEYYRELCLASVTTHDIPPTAGYLDLAHVRLRERLGLLTRPVEEESAVERRSIDRVRAMLVHRQLLAGADVDDVEAVVVALHAYLASTPSRMLGVALSDLVGDRRIINQPGTENEYPNWRVPLGGPDEKPLSLEEAVTSPLVAPIVATLPSSRG